MKRTIKKIVLYAPHTHKSDNIALNTRKIKLIFTDGTVKAFYQGLDKVYDIIVRLAGNKILASEFTLESRENAIRPYIAYIITNNTRK